MTYLDYSATTPVSEEVLESFCEVSRKYIGNPNSLHRLGTESNNLINSATKQIQEILNTNKEILFLNIEKSKYGINVYVTTNTFNLINRFLRP